MKYGEKIEFKRYFWDKYYYQQKIVYRFRIDPVPFIYSGHGKFGCYYKRPKTTQEKKLFYKYSEYVRGKRTAINLPNSWDDYPRSDIRTRKSWKKRCKHRKQWMKNCYERK